MATAYYYLGLSGVLTVLLWTPYILREQSLGEFRHSLTITQKVFQKINLNHHFGRSALNENI